LKERLLEALGMGGEVQLELSAASGLDITAFQLIWAAERAAKKAGVAFSLVGPVQEQIALALADGGLPFPALEPFPVRVQ